MVKLTINNWKTLKIYMERLESEKVDEVKIEATLFINDELAQTLMDNPKVSNHRKEKATEGVKTSKLSKEAKTLKTLYQKQDYQKVIDYIYTKNEFLVGRARNIFIMEERILAEVIKISLKAGFIEEEKCLEKTIQYKVKPIARVWFVILRGERKATLDTITARIHDLSRNQVRKAIQEGLEKDMFTLNIIRGVYEIA